ncbi:MAG: C4-type zinc ribbon domain-containing protein [Verrucomicrobiota bacterium]|nr:C4-type zinc ribbon domain-containing protein [Verrucomicrobiota bacterium]
MHPAVTQLLIIQDKDRKITHLKLEQTQIPLEEGQIAAELKANMTSFEELKTKTKQVEAVRKKLELDAQSKRDTVAKFKSQMAQTKKNDEYQAFMREIDHNEKDIVVIEDEELTLMQDYESLNAQIVEEQKRVKEYEKLAATQKEDLKNKATVVDEKLKALLAERAEDAAQVEVSSLSKYERILSSKKDAAVVPIVHGTTCGGCHMKITTTTVHASKSETVLAQCENCGRIVYFDE